MPLTKDQAMKLLEDHKEKMKKDPSAAAQFLCENVKILPNHSAAVSGKSAIESHHKEKAAKFADFDMKHTIDEVLNEGDIAIVDGTCVISKGGKELDTGKFMSVLKNEGGSYKLLRAMHNTSKPHPDMCK